MGAGDGRAPVPFWEIPGEAEAFQRGARERGGNLRIHGRCLSRLREVTAYEVRTSVFLWLELSDNIGIVVNPVKTVALPPEGHAPTAEEILLLGTVDVRITDGGGVTVANMKVY